MWIIMLTRTAVHWQSSVGVGDKFGVEQYISDCMIFNFLSTTIIRLQCSIEVFAGGIYIYQLAGIL